MDYMLSVPGMRFKLPVSIELEDGRLRFRYSFSKEMNTELKNMKGAKYHGYDDPSRKYWTVEDCARNWFNIRYMAGENVFKQYELPIIPIKHDIAKGYQCEGVAELLIRRREILAWEMGLGKTLTTIIAMIESGIKDWYWMGTKGSLREMSMEFYKWKCPIKPTFLTYEGLKKVLDQWPDGEPPPRGIVFDELSKAKGYTTERAKACRHISEANDKHYGNDGMVIGLTGTPAPKDPCDWFSLVEIVRPGFIREGTYQKFKARMCLQVQREGQYGMYPETITWWDNEDKCAICGQLVAHPNHDSTGAVFGATQDYHPHARSRNEVIYLYERLKGLVNVKFKKDCLKDLPPKRYHVERLVPSESLLRTAKSITRTARSAVTALTLLRELSDGFQYTTVENGVGPCDHCEQTGEVLEYYDPSNPDSTVFDLCPDGFKSRPIVCPTCTGRKTSPRYIRSTVSVPCPKDEYFADLLEKHEDIGRFVCFAGFTGSIDRCVDNAHRQGWSTIRIDARGWEAVDHNGLSIPVKDLFDKERGDPYLQLFQNGQDIYPQVVIIAHPKSGGMGLNLTASPGIYFYSNSFDGEDRMQAEDRGHRPGMDLNAGLTIYDNYHLPTDELVHNNLIKKVKLQNMTLGLVQGAIDV